MLPVKRILFPTDLLEFSRAALPFACTLARQMNAKLDVLFVMPPVLYQDKLEERNHPEVFYAGAREALERFVLPEPGIEIERTVTTGKPAKAIVAMAAETSADLVVMATHAKTGLAHLFLGSVAEQVLRNASCPVLCIKTPQIAYTRAKSGRLKVRKILCPVDFSGSCTDAVKMAITLATEYHARVMLLHVASLTDMASAGFAASGIPAEIDQYLADRRSALEKLATPERQVPVERRVEHGQPAEVIVDLAREMGAELIVMGTHGYKGLTHAVMGSVAEQVVRRATCPVLTLRPAGSQLEHAGQNLEEQVAI